jgi:predicted sulfurtransferase
LECNDKLEDKVKDLEEENSKLKQYKIKAQKEITLMGEELKTLRHEQSTQHLEPLKNDEDLQNQLLEEQTRNEVYL